MLLYVNNSSILHGMYFLDSLNFKKYGIGHSGQAGDAIVGTLLHSDQKYNNYYELLKEISHSHYINLNERVKLKLNYNYMCDEEFLFFIRVFMMTNQGIAPMHNFSESCSPFLDIDFLNFCFKIPVELRRDNNLRYKWILKKHPKAAKYVYSATNARIDEEIVDIMGRKIPISRVSRFLHVRKLEKTDPEKSLMYQYSTFTKNNMNPLDYWYNNNQGLRNYIIEYFNENIVRASSFNNLESDCRLLFENGGTVMSKYQVLTLLSVLKRYF